MRNQIAQPNRIELKEQAKKLLKGNMWNIWKPLLVIIGVSLLTNYVVTEYFTEVVQCPNSEIFKDYVCTEVNLYGKIINFLSQIIDLLLGVGLVNYVLKIIRKEQFSFKDLFTYFKQKIGLCFIAGLLVSLFTSFWTLLLVFPGVIAALSYSMWKPLIIDGSEGALDTIRASKNLMKGHKANYLVLLLSFTGWMLLCIITLGVGAIYVFPYFIVTKTLYYEKIKNIKHK